MRPTPISKKKKKLEQKGTGGVAQTVPPKKKKKKRIGLISVLSHLRHQAPTGVPRMTENGWQQPNRGHVSEPSVLLQDRNIQDGTFTAISGTWTGSGHTAGSLSMPGLPPSMVVSGESDLGMPWLLASPEQASKKEKMETSRLLVPSRQQKFA
jgi:hypothetical protein